MTPATTLASALRHHARGISCLEAAAELLITQPWLQRADFTDHFVTLTHDLTDGTWIAVVDWPTAISTLHRGDLPCSSAERRMLHITASLADGIPVDLRDTLTGLDRHNTQLLTTALLHAAGHPLP